LEYEGLGGKVPFNTRLIRNIIGIVIGIAVTFIIAYIYIGLNGSSWAKIRFKNEAETCLRHKYGFSENIRNHEVYYSFKEGTYYSKVTLKNGVTFVVKKDYSNELYDTYVNAVIRRSRDIPDY